tara:strand:+ start:3114 stop:3659 length:546 start_codon:yes stop_codon:yes gene_type:complete
MKIESISKFLKYIIPISLTTFFILFFMKKNNLDYVSVEMDIPSDVEMDIPSDVEMDIPSDVEIERINVKSSSINKFQLRSFMADNKYDRKSTFTALNNNPFEELGTVESSYNQLPRDLKFTGILKVGDQEGVFVSSARGLDVFYSGQEVAKGYKIMSINSKNAEIIISNGLNTKLVKLVQE